MPRTHYFRGAGVVRVGLPLLVVLLALGVGPVRAGAFTVEVPPPNGTDDTAALQAALDQCVNHGARCAVQLAAGRYLSRQLVVYDFRGTLRGRGRDVTVIEALPNLEVDSWIEESDTYWPPSAEHPWPSLVIFVDGDIHISDLAIHITQVPATQPYFIAPGWQLAAVLDAVRVMGERRTNLTVSRVAIEGQEDPSELSLAGFNLGNGIIFAGELPKPTGIPFDYYQITGRLSVRASRFDTLAAGVAPVVIKDGRVSIGGSPGAGNVFTNVGVGVDFETLENSIAHVSHNEVVDARWAAAWVVPWCCGFLPTKPSLFFIRNNTFEPAGQYADGVLLLDDPSTPWIRAIISNNTIEAHDIGYGGISVINTDGTKVLNNRISGHGANGIGVWNGTHGAVLANRVGGFIADSAQVVLDGTTTHSTVFCRNPDDTVLNEGQDNHVIGCQLVEAP